ncbi:IGR protein motif-domain-containing protein [Annulohypoxylon moriforme]|nr:IGR protein motif-domain-containing protein [Annulohypoxylon moriforme]
MVRIKPFLRPQQLRAAINPLNRLSPFQTQTQITTTSLLQQQSRLSSSTTSPTSTPPAIPSPTPFVPDVTTFLTVIGRGLLTHASKFPTWESLFSLTSDQLRELGVEPPRTRRYLLQWRQRFRRGQYGVGGDLQHVSSGQAALAVWEAPATDKASAAAPRKYVVNVPEGRTLAECKINEISRVRGYKVKGAKTIVGPYALPLSGGERARVTITEGMWEDRRGHKIDGGERRRTEIRYKKRIAERREMRERDEL